MFSRTIKTTVFTTKTVVFLTFTAKTKLPQSHSGDIQGTNDKNGGIFRFGLLTSIHHVGDTIGGLGHVFCNDVCVNRFGGGDVGMAQIF